MTTPTTTPTTAPTKNPLPRAVVVLGVVSLLTDASSEMIIPLLPALMLGTLGGSTMMLGFVDGLADALSAILKLVAGRLSDGRPSKKPFVLFGYGLSTAVRPLIGLAMAPWHIVVVRAVDRVGKGVRSAPRDAILAASVDANDSERAFGFHRAMDHAGAVVGPLLATAVLAVGFDVRTAIQLAWIPGILALIALSTLREPPPLAPPEKKDPTTKKKPLPPKLKALLVVVGVFAVASVADTFLLVRARDLGVNDALLPIVWVALHFAKVVASSQVSKLPWRGVSVVVAAWVCVAVGFALAAVSNVVVFGVAVILVGVGHGGREPTEKALVRRLADKDAMGGSFGAYHLTAGIAALPAGLWVGGLWSLDGVGGAATLLVSAATTTLAALLLWASKKTIEQPAQPTS